MGGNLLKSDLDSIIDIKTFMAINDENNVRSEDVTLSSVEPLFFGDEKVIERIVSGSLNTIPLGDLMG